MYPHPIKGDVLGTSLGKLTDREGDLQVGGGDDVDLGDSDVGTESNVRRAARPGAVHATAPLRPPPIAVNRVRATAALDVGVVVAGTAAVVQHFVEGARAADVQVGTD